MTLPSVTLPSPVLPSPPLPSAGLFKGPAAGDGAAGASAPYGLLVPLPAGAMPAAPPQPFPGAMLVLVSLGEADGDCEGEPDEGSVVGGGLLGEAGVVGVDDAVGGVVDGGALDGVADGVGAVVAEGGVDDGRGEGQPGAGD
jgi:hypothetical protein